ncbi:type III effector protein [Escherichia coli]
MSVGNEEKYSITHKDITNLITGDRQSFLKLTLWEFILDLFPMYHIKEAKETIVEFVTKTEDKVKRFERIKYLAIPEEKWRFSATTEFTVDENKDIIVSRVFKININSKDHHNEAEENKIHSVFSEVLSLDIYKHDIQFDEKALQSGILKMQFPNDNEKLSVYLKNKIPFENMTFTGNISYENLNGPVFENCFFESCNFENVSLVGFDKVTCKDYDFVCRVKPNNKIPIYGMFKGCFLYQCEMKNFKIETSKIYSVNQDPKEGKKVGAYLFMQSFVYESNLQDGDCKEASVIASGLLSCKIAKLNGDGMDFIETSFYRKTSDRSRNSNNFYDCDFRYVNMTCKRDGIREDLRDYDPRKYFAKSENKLNLDKHLLDVIQENIFQNMKTHYNINDDIDNHLKLNNCCLYAACLGELTGGNPLHDCEIDTYTTRLSGNLAANTQVKIPVYMSYRGAIAENDILPFMKKLTEIDSRIKDINEHSDNLKNNYKKALADLQSLLVNLHNIMPGDDVKDFQLNDETIKYIIDNVLYNRKKDIANEIDIDKVNFMHNIYNNLDCYRRFDENGKIKTYRSINPNGNRFYFDFNDLQFLYYDHEKKNGPKVEDFVKMQNVFLTVKNFKAEEKINQEKYTEKPADVAREIASFFDIEQYLLGVIDRNGNYITENFTAKMKMLSKLTVERNAQLERKIYFDEKMLELNDNDEKGKVKIENDIEKIDKIIEEIDNKILDLSSETERFKINFQQENRLNDVVQGISRWLKENHLMVEAIKKTDTE